MRVKIRGRGGEREKIRGIVGERGWWVGREKERMGGWEGERGWGVGREREILSTVHFTDINVCGMRESERERRGKRERKR